MTDRVMLWTRVTTDGSDPVTVNWVIGEDEAMKKVVGSGSVEAIADSDWTVHVDATGLKPDTIYYYGFRARSTPTHPLPGRARCRPTTRPPQVRHGVVRQVQRGVLQRVRVDREPRRPRSSCCTSVTTSTRCRTPRRRPKQGPARHRPPVRSADRVRHARGLSNALPPVPTAIPTCRPCITTLPIIPTLDDHEFADGAWSGGSTEHKARVTAPGKTARSGRCRHARSTCPIRRPDPKDLARVFRTVSVGKLADIWLTDTRSRRDEPVPGAGDARSRSALGRTRARAWLINAG